MTKLLFIFSFLLILSQAKAQNAGKTAEVGGLLPLERKIDDAPPSQESDDSVAEEEPYDAAEEMPRFPGDEKAMYDWIYKNLNYPAEAQERGVQGVVWVRFVVSKTGKVERVRIFRGIDSACDKEALRVVASLPDWTPGRQDGRNVPVYYMVRIIYKMPR